MFSERVEGNTAKSGRVLKAEVLSDERQKVAENSFFCSKRFSILVQPPVPLFLLKFLSNNVSSAKTPNDETLSIDCPLRLL